MIAQGLVGKTPELLDVVRSGTSLDHEAQVETVGVNHSILQDAGQRKVEPGQLQFLTENFGTNMEASIAGAEKSSGKKRVRQSKEAHRSTEDRDNS